MKIKVENEKKFYELAHEIIEHPDNYVRKLSDKDIEAYDNGDDAFGDIVLWVKRQLDMCEYLDDLIEDSEETKEEWFAYEVECLELLIYQNRKEEKE